MKESFQESALSGAGFERIPPPEGFGPLWHSYHSASDLCTGWFHFLSPEQALWSISIHDFTMRGDFVMDTDPPDYLTVTWFKSIAGEEFSPYRKLKPDSIWGQSIGGGPWRGVGMPRQVAATTVQGCGLALEMWDELSVWQYDDDVCLLILFDVLLVLASI